MNGCIVAIRGDAILAARFIVLLRYDGQQTRAADPISFLIEDGVCAAALLSKLGAYPIRSEHSFARDTGCLCSGDRARWNFLFALGGEDFEFDIWCLALRPLQLVSESPEAARLLGQPK